jgi:hypothetical protein
MLPAGKYPKYLTHSSRGHIPTVLMQEYPLPTLAESEIYYPENKRLSHYLTTTRESQLFGAALFCIFLADTIEVEHNIVIPAVASLNRMRQRIPAKARQDLFKTATDEAFHAEQSLMFQAELEDFFGLHREFESEGPLFIRRLDRQIFAEPNVADRHLMKVLNGIVTETRISVELGQFAADNSLSDTVRAICLSHATDEGVHASQFKALGIHLWQEEFDEAEKNKAAGIFMQSAIARSLPDIENMISALMMATGRSYSDARRIVLREYNEEILIEDMMYAARPTFHFLSSLGTDSYITVDSVLDKERDRIRKEMYTIRKKY